MSRYKIPSNNVNYDVVVGWDPPLSTYFCQVEDKTIPEDSDLSSLVFSCGMVPDEVQTLERLAELTKPYATIPLEIEELLLRDMRQPWEPTPFQKEMINLVRKINEEAKRAKDRS
jgi:hypothetical protein